MDANKTEKLLAEAFSRGRTEYTGRRTIPMERPTMPKHKNNPPLAINEHEAAARLGMSVQWLRKDRYGAQVIPFYRVGSRVLYDPARIAQALKALEVGGAKK